MQQNNIIPNNSDAPNNSSLYGGNPKLCEQNNNNLFDINKVDNKKAEKVERRKEKSASLSKLLTVFVAAVAGVAICITGIDSILPTYTNAKLECFSILNTSVYYFVELEEFDEYKDNVKVILSNDFTKREQVVEFSSYEGYFEDLKPNVKYTIKVVKGNTILAEKTFKTLSDEEYDEKYNYSTDYNFDQNIEEIDKPITKDGPVVSDPNYEELNEYSSTTGQ